MFRSTNGFVSSYHCILAFQFLMWFQQFFVTLLIWGSMKRGFFCLKFICHASFCWRLRHFLNDMLSVFFFLPAPPMLSLRTATFCLLSLWQFVYFSQLLLNTASTLSHCTLIVRWCIFMVCRCIWREKQSAWYGRMTLVIGWFPRMRVRLLVPLTPQHSS